VAGYSTEVAGGPVQVFLRTGGVVEEMAYVSTLGAEFGWREKAGINPEVWGLGV